MIHFVYVKHWLNYSLFNGTHVQISTSKASSETTSLSSLGAIALRFHAAKSTCPAKIANCNISRWPVNIPAPWICPTKHYALQLKRLKQLCESTAFRNLLYMWKGNPTECIQQGSLIHSSRQLCHFTKATKKASLQLGRQKWPLWHIRRNQWCFPSPFLLFALSGFFPACVVSEELWDISFCFCASFWDISQPISCSFSPNHYSKPVKERTGRRDKDRVRLYIKYFRYI